MVLEKNQDCIFCKIVNGDIPAEIVYQDDRVIAFHDAHPHAPVHVLVIPRQHIARAGEIDPADIDLLGYMNQVAAAVAKKKGIYDEGYRMVINSGDNGGQTVYHLHLHVLGGRVMHWPPG